MKRSNLLRRSAAVLSSALVVQAGGLPCFAAVARADDAPRVVILPLVAGKGSPAKAPDRFRELLQGELRSRESLSVLDLSTGRVPAAPVEGTATPPAGAIAALEEGHQKLADLRFDAAAEALSRGIAKMTERPEAADFEQLVDAWIALAVAHFRMGDEEGAQKALGTVVRVAPQYRLPDGRFPPIFVREFEKARRRTEKVARGSIAIDGPPGATAFLDGRALGKVPVIEENLVPGTHYVKVEGTSGELYGEVVEVKRGRVRVKARFGGGGGGGRLEPVGPVLNEDARARAAAAARSLEADFAVVGVVYRSGEHQLTAATAVYSARHDGFAALKTYTFDDEMLTANVEAYKLADDVADQVAQFARPATLPIDLAAGATYTAVASKRAPESVEAIDLTATARRSALTPVQRPAVVPDEHAREEDDLRWLEQPSLPAEALQDPPPPIADGEVRSGGVAWWVWAVVGVGVAAAAGGTYYGVTQATRPVTGTVTARW